MAPDSLIVRLVGSLILALLTGTWQPLPPDSISVDLPAPVSFSAQWHPLGQDGNEVDQIIVLGDGSTRLGVTSSIVSPVRGSRTGSDEALAGAAGG